MGAVATFAPFPTLAAGADGAVRMFDSAGSGVRSTGSAAAACAGAGAEAPAAAPASH